MKKSEQYANAVDKLDADGVIQKADILSGKVKLTASKAVAASKAATAEDARAILFAKKPSRKSEPEETADQMALRTPAVRVCCPASKAGRFGDAQWCLNSQ